MGNTVDFSTLCIATTRAIVQFTQKCKELNPKNKTSGILIFEDVEGNIQHDVVGYGVIEKGLCLTTARLKIAQLKSNPTHLSSYQSRNPAKGLWGGGFFVPEVGYVALSGLPEFADEACLICALLYEKIVQAKYAVEALTPSNNHELLQHVLSYTKKRNT